MLLAVQRLEHVWLHLNDGLLWTQEAVRDREEIYNYIEEDNPLAALAFDDLLSEGTIRLQDYPKIGRTGRVPGTLELIVHSNYIVVYEVVQAQVRILNVVHTARQWPQLQE